MAIRNLLTRGDLGGLRNLTMCGGIGLLCGSRIADGFPRISSIAVLLRNGDLREPLGVNRNSHYRRGVSEYNV